MTIFSVNRRDVEIFVSNKLCYKMKTAESTADNEYLFNKRRLAQTENRNKLAFKYVPVFLFRLQLVFLK